MISDIRGNYGGGRIKLPGNRETDTGEKMLRNVGLGGGNDVLMGDLTN